MTAMQRIEIKLIHLGYLCEASDNFIKATKLDNKEQIITIKKDYRGYYLISNLFIEHIKQVSKSISSATDVIWFLERIHKGDTK